MSRIREEVVDLARKAYLVTVDDEELGRLRKAVLRYMGLEVTETVVDQSLRQ